MNDDRALAAQEMQRLQQQHQTELEALRRDCQAAKEEARGGAQTQQELHAQLEQSNQQRRGLQEDFQNLQRQAAEQQRQWTVRCNLLEEQLSQYKVQLDALTTERATWANERATVTFSQRELGQQLTMLQAQLRDREEQLAKLNTEGTQTIQGQRAQLSSLTESLSKYKTQLEQSKGLLQVMTDQRNRLNAELGELRAENDDLHRKLLQTQQAVDMDAHGVIDDLQRRNRALDDKVRSLEEYRTSPPSSASKSPYM
ncbi:hypothetical protein PAPYR_10318 [Paratrimastix pyriformis]|uniref:Uncharacterized protein n=1 Tax=Paratrimastix pyriformis TaxID=342808 RepID=A0ABQ8U6A4_9EUKA|nr:hypothetical protein PAPYR_10318 [Paratrimastix pyriformis]